MSKLRLLSCAGLACLSACATSTTSPNIDTNAVKNERLNQQVYAFNKRLNEYTHVQTVARKIIDANEEFCTNKKPYLGFEIGQATASDKSYRLAFEKIFGSGQSVRVVFVQPNQIAANAGLEKGDVVISYDGMAIPKGKNIRSSLYNKLEEASKDGKLNLEITRQNGEASINKTIELKPKMSCNIEVSINDIGLNAYATGKEIFVGRDLLHFVKNDSELALVMGHELAHNLEGHIAKVAVNSTGGFILGTAVDVLVSASTGISTNTFGNLGAAATSNSVAFEKEADYIGMYYAARAGYDISGVEDLWRRWAAEAPKATIRSPLPSHPSTPERFISLGEITKEINDKVKNGEPLLPNRKKFTKSQSADKQTAK